MALALAAACLVLPASAAASDAGGHVPSAGDRYTLANGCFGLRSVQTGNYLVRVADGYNASAAAIGGAEPFRMQATDLGSYLVYDSAREFLTRSPLLPLPNSIVSGAAPEANADWTVTEDGGAFRLSVAGRDLSVGAGGTAATVAAGGGGDAARWEFELRGGCVEYPEVEVNVDGPLPGGDDPADPVRGLVETHMHQMAFEFLGTKAHCGRPWHRFGAPFALQDCPDHEAGGGCGAVLETALSGTACHDPGGWPSFAGWPEHNHYTHEQSYYKWLERSWRGGLKVFVNLLVENRVLCQIYPLTPPGHNCNEMETVRREAVRMRELERYIDAQNGGPGKGWYRIVETPGEARQAIADGKLAVVMGMEVSEPFGCRIMQPGNMPLCTESQVDAGLKEIWDLGVRQLELVNKFDNALTGVAGDSGTVGTITNLGNVASAGTFFDFETCTNEDSELNHDHAPTAASHNDDALASAVLDLFGDTTGVTLPVYGSTPLCNQRGLSNLGERAIRGVMERGMIFDPDHMSVIARNRALDIVEERKYPGVMTSHSWSTDNALPRIAKLGGLIGPAAKSPTGFVAELTHLKTHGYDDMNPHLFGVGYGADMNGFASQGGPPATPITYPFQSPVDPAVTIHEQVSGERTFDYNVTGTAHYGLYPDWAEAVRIAGGPEIANDLANGAEAYLQMWERTVAASGPGPSGEDPDRAGSGGDSRACAKWPRRFKPNGFGKRLRLGYSRAKALASAGEPRKRRGRAWVWCTREKRGHAKRVTALFDGGRISLIARTGKGKAAGIKRGHGVRVLDRRAEPAGKNLWTRAGSRGKVFFYRVRKGRVAFVGVASGVPGPAELRARLRRAGL
jgi:hypothetical protein